MFAALHVLRVMEVFCFHSEVFFSGGFREIFYYWFLGSFLELLEVEGFIKKFLNQFKLEFCQFFAFFLTLCLKSNWSCLKNEKSFNEVYLKLMM